MTEGERRQVAIRRVGGVAARVATQVRALRVHAGIGVGLLARREGELVLVAQREVERAERSAREAGDPPTRPLGLGAVVRIDVGHDGAGEVGLLLGAPDLVQALRVWVNDRLAWTATRMTGAPAPRFRRVSSASAARPARK